MSPYPRVIIESPYAGEIKRNVTYARRCVRDSLRRGEAPIASHLLYTQEDILDDSVPEQRSTGIKAGLEWFQVAHVIAFYTDLGWSLGMMDAWKLAIELGRPSEFRSLRDPIKLPPQPNSLNFQR